MTDQVIQIEASELAMRVREFVEQTATRVECVVSFDGGDDNGPRHYAPDELLGVWIQCPEGNFTPMFIGWCIARGIAPNTYGLHTLMDAVCIALTGKSLNVVDGEFNDGSRKSH